MNLTRITKFVTAFLLAMLILCEVSAAADFRPILLASSNDWVAYNGDCTKIAIVHTEVVPNFGCVGKDICVYNSDANFMPAKSCFVDNRKDRLVTEFQWVGNNLIYLTIKNPRSIDFNRDGSNTFTKSKWLNLQRHFETEAWPHDSKRGAAFGAIKCFPPGNLFSSGTSSKLVIFDTFDDMLKFWDERHKMFRNEYFTTRSLRTYTLPSGVADGDIRVRLRLVPARWGYGKGHLVPLFVSSESLYLIALVSSNKSWQPTADADVPSVIRVNLKTGDIISLTPEGEEDSLRLFEGDYPKFFALGNPIPINNAKNFICQLSTSEANAKIAYRFGVFDMNGKMLSQTLIWTRDLEQSKVPLGVVITWCPDARSFLIQSNNVWVMDWQKKIGREIAQNLNVEQMHGWLDKNHLLVLAVRNRSGLSKYTSCWGVIDTSKAPTH